MKNTKVIDMDNIKEIVDEFADRTSRRT